MEKDDSVPLRQYVDMRLDELESSVNRRFDAVTTVNAVTLASQKEATNKAEASANQRFDKVNEFRAQQADLIQTFSRKTEADIQFKTLTDRIEKIETNLATTTASNTAKSSGMSQGWAWAVAVIGLIGLVTGIILAFAR